MRDRLYEIAEEAYLSHFDVGADNHIEALKRGITAALAAMPQPDCRALAVDIVDSVRGYTFEFANNPLSHKDDYDWIEEKLRTALTTPPRDDRDAEIERQRRDLIQQGEKEVRAAENRAINWDLRAKKAEATLAEATTLVVWARKFAPDYERTWLTRAERLFAEIKAGGA